MVSFKPKGLFFSKASGCFALAVGVIAIIGWYAHSSLLRQAFPSLPAMKYNTALGFVLCGAALLLLSTHYGDIASLLGVFTGQEAVLKTFDEIAQSAPRQLAQLKLLRLITWGSKNV
jgi:hypothetical protein